MSISSIRPLVTSSSVSQIRAFRSEGSAMKASKQFCQRVKVSKKQSGRTEVPLILLVLGAIAVAIISAKSLTNPSGTPGVVRLPEDGFNPLGIEPHGARWIEKHAPWFFADHQPQQQPQQRQQHRGH